MKHQLPKLPYAQDALEPYFSKKSINLHYEKHHKKYVNNLNKLIPGTQYETLELDEIIEYSKGPVFNNAAQVWNHTFFFKCMHPNKKKIGEKTMKLIEDVFGSVEEFKKQVVTASLKHFGSGWCFVLKKDNKLLIRTTNNAGTFVNSFFGTPILAVDLWEHAYYTMYYDDRKEYLNNFWLKSTVSLT